MFALNHLLAFLIELAALGAYGLWGWRHFDSILLSSLSALGCAAVVALIWAFLAAPNSRHRLRPMSLLLFKTALFAGATLALANVGYTSVTIAFGVVAALQMVLALTLRSL